MICLIGGKGSIGSRYGAIMRHNNIPYVVYDVDTPNIKLDAYSKFIIATPTDTHVEYLNKLKGATILCEKPVSKNPAEIPSDPKMYVVNNYFYAVHHLLRQKPPYFITYDYFKTGSDGLFYDCCQLIHLDPQCEIKTSSPKWNMSVNGNIVAYRTIEESYVRMICDFAKNRFQNLWGMDRAKEMTQAVIDRIERESTRKV